VNWARIVLSFIVGMTVFGAVQSFLHFNVWVSAAIAVAATLVTWIERALAMADKALDIRKKWLDIQKLQREEEEFSRRVQLATPDEIQKHGMSYTQRQLTARIRSKTQETVKPNPFIADSHEDKL
jgi:hypothetical protein